MKEGLPTQPCCRLFEVSRSGFYQWRRRAPSMIPARELELYRVAKQLFAESRESLGSRELMKMLNHKGFKIGRYKVRKIMYKLNLVVKQRVAYKVTTQRDKRDLVAPNLVNMDFNPIRPNEVWAGDITYLRTDEGWMYLSIVMDLYSRRIVGWSIDKRMTTELVERSFLQAYWLRKPSKGLIFHSDRGAQYTSNQFKECLKHLGIRQSMGSTGACWDNAVVERFFGSLKHDWLFKVHQPSREHMKQDVTAYMHYYNLKRLHTANGNMSPVDYENCKINVSTFA